LPLLHSLVVNAPREYQQFVPLPSDETIVLAWPTPNQFLFDAPEKFFARTRVNPDYGKPGWTRDCGKRFHRGCDIASVNLTGTGETTRVIFTDCATGKDFSSDEPTFVPHDHVFRVFDGEVSERVDDKNASDFGKHVVIEHRWPRSGQKFFTLYAHLAEIDISGERIGRMGQTSRSADARNWMAIAPHLHFEVWNADRRPYDPAEFLRRFVLRGLPHVLL
jgi:murein DD-endopeptidase MepM/ murein hydrolase activator NlpD